MDFWRELWGIQTKLEKLQTEAMVRRIASRFKVDADILVAVIWAESGMNPKAVNRNQNGTTDYGLCQFNDYWYRHAISPYDALNHPERAVEVMCRAWEIGRQNDWIAYRNKSYLQYVTTSKNTAN